MHQSGEKNRYRPEGPPFDTRRSPIGKSLPADPDAEKAVLGSILLNDESIYQVIDLLTPDDFYSWQNRTVYAAMLALSRSGNRIDLISLKNKLGNEEQLEKVGGTQYLVELQENIASLGLTVQHSRIVREKAILRKLIGSSADIMSKCYGADGQDIDELLDRAEKLIFSISTQRADSDFVQLNIWLKKTFKHLSELKEHTHGVTGIATGYHQLDDMSSGLQSSDLIVLAARPSMGKTALALSIAKQAARAGKSVGFFSLEMAAEQLTLRLISSESGIPHHRIRNATVDSDEWVFLTNTASKLANLKLYIDDTAMMDILELRAKARKLKLEKGLDLLLVDYLQLVNCGRRHENRHQEVSEVSRSLKALAKELSIPVVALSQLSRAVDSRLDKRPMLSDLRESGAIEQDADLILFLYRDVIYNKDTDEPDAAELIIGKQRNGPTGMVPLHFAKEQMRFENM